MQISKFVFPLKSQNNIHTFGKLSKNVYFCRIIDYIIFIFQMRIGESSFSLAISENRIALMGLSMFSIMLHHQYFTSVIPFNFFHNYGHWGVDVFLFLSGMGLVNSLNKYSLKVFYLRRFFRLFPSCILCGTIRLFLILLLGSFSVLLKEKLNYSLWTLASMDLWFIHTIIILYAISPFLYWLLNKWPLTTITIILFFFFFNGFVCTPIVGFDWMSPLGVASWTIERLPVFTFGMLIGIGNIRVPSRIPLYVFSLIIAFCLVLVGKVCNTIVDLQACIYILLAFGMPALIYLLLRIVRVTPKALLQPLNFMGAYSLEIYLVHEFIFWVLQVVYINGNPCFLIPLSFLLSCFSAYLCKRVTIMFKLLK